MLIMGMEKLGIFGYGSFETEVYLVIYHGNQVMRPDLDTH